MSKIKKLIPRYAVLPLLAVVFFNALAYYGSNLLAKNFYHYNITMAIDSKIPFIEFFVVFYVLAYLQWVVNYILLAREGRQQCYRFVTADILAKLFCLVIFIAFPTTTVLPTPSKGVFGRLIAFIYAADEPTNLLPSIHCLESWVCIRASFTFKKVPIWYRGFTVALSLAVFLSTIFIKQHLLIDIPAGIIVFELAFLIVKLTKVDKKLCSKLSSKDIEH